MKTKAGRLEPGQWVLVDGFQYFQVKEVQKHPQGDRGQVWITFSSRQGAKEIHKFWSLIEQVEVREDDARHTPKVPGTGPGRNGKVSGGSKRRS